MENWGSLFIFAGVVLEAGGIYLLLKRSSAGYEMMVLGILCLLVGWLA